jgi:hypothetical protein
MKLIKEILAIFSNQKSFDGIIGNPVANRIGLHVFRILLSDGVYFLRTLPFFFIERKARKYFAKNGVIIIENFLGHNDFCQVQTEAHQRLAALPPAPANNQQGFGEKKFHDQGFDRYDGDTINRFADIKENSAIMKLLVKNPRLSLLTFALFGQFN